METIQITKQFEFNHWANLRMIRLCQTLTPEQLTYTIDGVFGDIPTTLAHLVSGEGSYIRHLTGVRPWADDLDFNTLSLAEMAEKADISGPRLVKIASQVDFNQSHRYFDREDQREYEFYSWTVLLQALYHGIEHRTQIKILLTHLSVPHPELSGWHYNYEITGQIEYKI